mmetsp:Transcript_31104/g.51375  ORF Transcript_31104/g.51375 Transcript_31104/m.51375 type:complete len:174 (+) Transcript_31104:126-647(+)|eukprot:CAMPEP_0119020052 /NCGR_PEP_ID=MMETSP1176-20130426/23233_1 /TAXON_ID=265551 /ORGANISM="Synedropsis recta cf, Strain CCMP1620" /LENGTH=173 /DNA_ID=CAMNT_0006974413 /DNA_START=48 /DNA_END=569 /DNA_ORIENTATION=-
MTTDQNRNEFHFVGLERLRGEFDRIRSLKRDPFAKIEKGRGIKDDDSTDAMTEPTLSFATSFDSMSVTDDPPLPMQRQQPKNCVKEVNVLPTPLSSNKTSTRSPFQQHASPKFEMNDDTEEENSPSPDRYFEDFNDWLVSVFSCTGSCYLPAASTAEADGSALEDEDDFSQRR